MVVTQRAPELHNNLEIRMTSTRHKRSTPDCGAHANAEMQHTEYTAVVPPGDPLIHNGLPTLERATTARTSRSPTRRCIHDDVQRSSSEGGSAMISPEEYAALPQSIQRKYFSPAERLSITQQGAAQVRKKQRRKQTWLSPTSTAEIGRRPQSAQQLDSRPPSSSYGPNSEFDATNRPVTRDQAAWFLGLPEKVRRQQFTKEEQTYLTEECQRSLQRRASKLNVVSPPASLRHRQHTITSSGPCEPTAQHQRDLQRTPDTTSVSSRDSDDTEMGILRLYSRKRASSAIQGNGPASSTHSPSPTPPLALSQPLVLPKRKSFNLAKSLTPILLPPPTLAPIPSVKSPGTPVTPQTVVLKSRLSRPCSVAPATSPLDLTADNHGLVEDTAIAHKRSHSDETLTCLSDPSTMAAIDDDGSIDHRAPPELQDDVDGVSLPTDGPTTPTAPGFDDLPIMPTSADVESEDVDALPIQLNDTGRDGESSCSSSSSTVGKHRTGSMESRPNLHTSASHDHFPSWQATRTEPAIRSIYSPLPLEPLSVNDDFTGAHGAFAAKHTDGQKSISRLFKSVRRHHEWHD